MELSKIREKIDAVDERILELFLQRMDLAEEVAAYKKEHGQPILSTSREQEILTKVTMRAGERGQYAYHLFSTLMELSRSRQEELLTAAGREEEQAKRPPDFRTES